MEHLCVPWAMRWRIGAQKADILNFAVPMLREKWIALMIKPKLTMEITIEVLG
ncbi:hypothetical protein J2S00_000165 [Caldalkalibacillus uzonensis]|uniref:Uncharacterized protein n=1 Tax=Caldalkalibacillus uzonensis TaxID=353224 RepID=A0ABU0CPG8_9BACI|nr:hypothetical protein [Caldalkalibacillus uzonensis]